VIDPWACPRGKYGFSFQTSRRMESLKKSSSEKVIRLGFVEIPKRGDTDLRLHGGAIISSTGGCP
jgi:hypothetical protein